MMGGYDTCTRRMTILREDPAKGKRTTLKNMELLASDTFGTGFALHGLHLNRTHLMHVLIQDDQK